MQWDQPVPQRDHSGQTQSRRTAGGLQLGPRVPKELGWSWSWWPQELDGAGGIEHPKLSYTCPHQDYTSWPLTWEALGRGGGRRLTCLPPLPSRAAGNCARDSTNCGRGPRGPEGAVDKDSLRGDQTEADWRSHRLHRPLALPTW